jgi:indole-3-glycerol phosphate synthase
MVIPSAPDILKQIVEVKRQEVEKLKIDVPISELEARIEKQTPPLNFAGNLMGNRVRIIAEVKKASPAKGLLRENFDPAEISRTYAENGAAAISVLTNADHFQGSIEHLSTVHDTVNPMGIPVLRKEFIYDPYQVYEARANGADAILLIVAMLSPDQLSELRALAEKFWMQTLVEIHNESELEIALDLNAEIIGVNNRNLRTFVTDISITEQLAGKIPAGKIVVSESGINSPEDISRVQAAGAHAALIGEALITSEDMGQKLAELV